MKNYIKMLAVLLLSSSFWSCKKYLDINSNPNSTESVDGKLLFSFAATSFANNRAGGDLYIPMALGGQSISSGGNSTEGVSWGAGSEDQYVFSGFSYANVWAQFYTSVAFNLKNAITQAETGVPVNRNGAAQAKVLLAETFFELASIYGDVPFSEALNDDIKFPKFDAQQNVMDGAIALIDEALGEFDSTSTTKFTGAYDLFFAGKIDRWMAAAKSLKLRMLMTMADADPAKAAAIGQMITDGGMISGAAQNMKAPFETGSGKRNPKYALDLTYNGGLDFFYASPYVVNVMKTMNDPRLPYYFDVPSINFETTNDTYTGIQPGANANDTVNAKLASTLHVPDQPEYFFTYQEQLFYEAEIYARGLGVTVDLAKATTLYKQALVESATFWGVDGSDASEWVNGLTIPSGAEDLLHDILYQHWIDKMDRGLDAFTQWRRSGPEGSEIPALTLPVNAPAGDLFRRYEYPANSETAANPNAPERVRFNVKTWFDL
jgi:Starch-binding associating with outer membrane